MILLYVLEWAIFILAILFVFTQIFIPFLRGTSFFPLLRKEGKISKEFAEATNEVYEEELKQQVLRKKREVEKLKAKINK